MHHSPAFQPWNNGLIADVRAILRDPEDLIILSIAVIAGYYLVTWLLFYARDHKKHRGLWWLFKKHGFIDWATSVFWVVTPLVLIGNMIDLASKGKLTLDLLLIYYVLFIFLFAFLYCMAEWHWPGSLIGIAEGEDVKDEEGKVVQPNRYTFSDSWNDELMYVVISLQTQTALGYNRVRPNRFLTDLIAGVQAVVTLFFVAVAIAQAVNLTAPASH